MGDERETFEMLEGASAEVGLLGTADISVNYPKYYCCEIPYLFKDIDHLWKYWAGPGKELNDMMEKEHGVRTIGILLRGARFLTANKPIRNIQDIRGLKMRLPEMQIMHSFWGATGALPTAIAFSEVYMALKTGVVDAQENPPESIESYKMYEVQKYIMSTRHIFAVNRYLLSMKWYNTLSKDEQQTFDASMKKCVDYAKTLTDAGDDVFLKRLADQGMEMINIDNEGFRKVAQQIAEDYAKRNWVPGLYERVRDL
jgi:TRAP-type C4-dicarboxylate transport system substrate-binding protein